jgi:nitrite reductase/ring-hydroxylating ferredoxin subunit
MTDSDAAAEQPPVPNNSSRSVTLEGRDLILVNRGGELFLYENNCPHATKPWTPWAAH